MINDIYYWKSDRFKKNETQIGEKKIEYDIWKFKYSKQVSVNLRSISERSYTFIVNCEALNSIK